MALVQPKAFLKTRTFWLNAPLALAASVGILTELLDILPAFDDILTFPPNTVRWIVLAITIGNLVIRRLTTQPTQLTPTEAVEVPSATLPRARPQEFSRIRPDG